MEVWKIALIVVAASQLDYYTGVVAFLIVSNTVVLSK